MNTSRRRALQFAAALAAAGATSAYAAYPDRVVTLVVPVPPGGATDNVARIIGKGLQDRLKQTVIIENKSGGSGNIASQSVLRSPADGYTLLLTAGPFSINPSLFKKLPFDTLKDFVPVAQITTFPSVLLVRQDTPARTLQEFVKLAKTSEKPLTVATPGNGSAQHLALELLKKKAGLEFLHVPYRGGTPAMQDLLGGQVPAMMANVIEAMPHIRAGKLRALAVTTDKRTALLPDVPTLTEAGLADGSTGGWSGIHVRAGTPPEVVDRLHREVNAILEMPEIQKQLTEMGFDVQRTSREDFDRFVRQQMANWKVAVDISGATVE